MLYCKVKRLKFHLRNLTVLYSSAVDVLELSNGQGVLAGKRAAKTDSRHCAALLFSASLASVTVLQVIVYIDGLISTTIR
jgi:hypothetical protein